ncbi:MAG: hypothetical protein ACXVJZ_12505 [Acidimicrobiia bacterium]
MNQLRTLVDFPQFQAGWTAGLILAPIVVLLGWSSRSRRQGRRSPYGLVGAAWVLGSLAALDGWFGDRVLVPIPAQLVWGLVVLAVGAELAARTPNPKFIGFVLAFPGALLVATATDLGAGGRWVTPLVVVTTTFGGPLAADVDRRAARVGLGPVLWLVTVIGVYATVPDTELVRPLVGVALPLALTGWPLRAARIGPGGAAAGTALLLWVAALQGYGRPGSIVGAAGALGLLLVEPLGRVVVRRRFQPWSRALSVRWFTLAFVAAHVVVVAYATRVAGFQADGGPALALLVPGLLGGAALGGFLGLSKRVRPHNAWFGPRRSKRTARRTHPASAAGVSRGSSTGPGRSGIGAEQPRAQRQEGHRTHGHRGGGQGGPRS